MQPRNPYYMMATTPNSFSGNFAAYRIFQRGHTTLPPHHINITRYQTTHISFYYTYCCKISLYKYYNKNFFFCQMARSALRDIIANLFLQKTVVRNTNFLDSLASLVRRVGFEPTKHWF